MFSYCCQCPPCRRHQDYEPIGNESLGRIFGVRHFQCFLLFCCLCVAYGMRVNLAVAIVAMTDNGSNSTNVTTYLQNYGKYHWDEPTKSLIQSSFFWGYIITQIPGGQIAQRIGAKFLLLTAITGGSFLTLLTPLAVQIGGWQLLVAVRIFEGLFQGVIFPSAHTLLSKWAPPDERGRLASCCYSGSQFGSTVMFASSGLIASSALGWPGIFYISGFAGLLWAICWYFYGASSPALHRSITAAERLYIESSLGHANDLTRGRRITPWSSILTSLAFWTLLVVHCAHNFGFWALLTEMPTYMSSVLGMDITNNAYLSSLPYLAMFLMSFVFTAFGDYLMQRQLISLGVSRKLFNTIGQWIPMIVMIPLGYVTQKEHEMAVFLLILAVGVTAATYIGFHVNHIDLAPNHAGTLMGLTNCAANVMGIVAPLTVGHLVDEDVTDPKLWRTVFFIIAAIYFFGNLLFITFGKTETQSWNNSPVYESINASVEPVHVIDAGHQD